MIANSIWLIQRALPVILLSTIPQLTQCNTLNYEAEHSGHPESLRMFEPRVQRAPFNSWAGKRSGSIGEDAYEMPSIDVSRLNGLQQFYIQQLENGGLGQFSTQRKRAPFNSWAGKRAPFNSWAGKRAPFNSWAGKRAPFNSWAGKRSSEEVHDSDFVINHGDDRFGDSMPSHRVKRSSGESMDDSFNTDNENDQNSHVRIARDASPSRQLNRRVRSNTAFSAWGGK